MNTSIQTIYSESPTIAYDQLLVPRLLDPWTRHLVDAVSLKPGEWVLDVAPGPGSLVSIAAERVGPTGRVVAAGSLSALRQVVYNPGPAAARLDFVETPPFPLNVPPRWFEAVLCQQGLQYYPRAEAALQAVHSALKPGGRLGLTIWCKSDTSSLLFSLRSVLDELQSRVDPTRPLRPSLQWYTARELVALLSDSGFQNIRVTLETIPMVFEGGIPQLLASLNDAALWNALSELSPWEQGFFEQKLVEKISPFIRDDKIILWAAAYMALASA